MSIILYMRRSRILLLIIWLLGILFPMAWLGRVWSGYGQIFSTLFAPEWMHYLMHALLFAGFAVLLLVTFRLPITPRNLVLIIIAVLAVGLFQEGLQLFSGVQILRWNSLIDLGVDLTGGGIGVLLVLVFRGNGENVVRESLPTRTVQRDDR